MTATSEKRWEKTKLLLNQTALARRNRMMANKLKYNYYFAFNCAQNDKSLALKSGFLTFTAFHCTSTTKMVIPNRHNQDSHPEPPHLFSELFLTCC